MRNGVAMAMEIMMLGIEALLCHERDFCCYFYQV